MNVLHGQETYYTFNKDIKGSTTSIVDKDLLGVIEYEYDDYGTPKITGESDFANEIMYTGAIYDNITGLYYMNARYYDSEMGRFLTQDSYRGEINDPYSLHLYAYCRNNPISYMDPSGHVPVSAIIGGVVGGISGAIIGKVIADYLGLKGWRKAALIAGATIAGAALGAFLGPKVEKLSRKAGEIVRQRIINANTPSASKCVKNCFVAGTQVAVENGTKSIEDIQIGDWVYAYDTETGEQKLQEVLETYHKEVNELAQVRVGDSRMIQNLLDLQELFNQECNFDEYVKQGKEYIESILRSKDDSENVFYEDIEDVSEREKRSKLRVEYYETDLVFNNPFGSYPVYRICYRLLEENNVRYFYEVEYLNGEFVDEYVTERKAGIDGIQED